MIPELELEVGPPLPTSGPSGIRGDPIAVPVPATTAGVQILGRDCYLLGWSFRETTGTAPAVAELFDGTSTGGAFLAAIDLTGGSFTGINQTPADAQASGAAAALAPAIGGAAGTLAFVQALQITGLGATAASEVTATLTGGLGGTINFPISVPAGVTVPITPIFVPFGTIGLQASAAATALTLNVPSFGAGNTLAQAALQGYTQVSPSPTSTAGGGSNTQGFGGRGLQIRSGLFLNVVSGSLKGAVYIRL